MKLKLPNWGSLCNPNLLTNSDFKSGIINQKGQTSYVGTQPKVVYGIDMWRCSNEMTKLEVLTNKIRIYNDSSVTEAIGYFIQRIEKNVNDYVTCAVYVSAITGTINCLLGIPEEEEGIQLKKGLNVFTFSKKIENLSQINFKINHDSSATIDYVKVEKGSYFTGMPVWNNSEELTKCMAYFRILDLSFTGGLSNGTYMPRQRFLFENIMKKIPSVNHVSTQTLYNCTAEIEYVDRFGITLKSIPTNKNDDWAILGYRVELDAYDYD